MKRWWLACLCAAWGCGGAAVPPASPTAPGSATAPEPVATGEAPPRPAARGADPYALPPGPRDDAPVAPDPPPLPLAGWEKVARTKGVEPVPRACAAYTSRAPSRPAAKDLVAALAEADPAKRDAMLASREGDDPPGLARALRAELAPVECADVVVDPFLAKAKTASGPYGHVLVGLSLAAKLARTAQAPPVMQAGTADKEKVRAFVRGPLRAWVVEQATAIETLGSGAAGLIGYGRGLAALEAGHADLRLVDRIRTSPVPSTWDAELKAVYEAALDEALEPRKQRGRDAVLVGLSDLADAGVVRDPRVERARALLAKLYGGRRIDAFDRLLLPEVAAPASTSPLARAASSLPTFWIDTLSASFGAVASGEDEAAAAALARGVPRALRARMRGSLDEAPPAKASAYARARLELGRLAMRRIDFVEAAYAAKRGASDADRLVLAAALTLAHGPNGARELMAASSPAALELRHTEALDALAAEGGPFAGMAAFDAAYLRSLAPPDGEDAAPYWRDVAERFRGAEAQLTSAQHKKEALSRAADADAAAAAASGAK